LNDFAREDPRLFFNNSDLLVPPGINGEHFVGEAGSEVLWFCAVAVSGWA